MDNGDNNVGFDGHLCRVLYFGTSKNLWKSDDISMSPEDVSHIRALIDEGGLLEKHIVSFHNKHWFVNEDSIYYTLALACQSSKLSIKRSSLQLAEKICQSSYSLLSFVHYTEKISAPKTGWGRSQKRFLSHWYLQKDAKELAVEVTKVPSAHGWNHKDVLCLAHVSSREKSVAIACVLKFIVKGLKAAEDEYGNVDEARDILTYLKAIHELKHITDHHIAARLIEMHNLAFEHVPTMLLKSKEIWTCLIPRLKLNILLNRLPYLHKLGFLKSNSPLLKPLLERLQDENALSEGDLGPMETFLPIRHFESLNRIVPGRLIRQSVPQLNEALMNLHLASFSTVPTTGKRYLVAVDVRNTMVNSHPFGCSFISPADVTALTLLALAKAETSNLTTLAFSTNSLVSFDVNNKMSLSDVTQKMKNVPMGPVHLAAPIKWALEKKQAFDLIIVFTDNQTSVGDSHPAIVMKEYRSSLTLPNAKFITCALCSKDFTLAPLDEMDMLDVAGFHMKLLKVIQDFVQKVF